MSYSQTSCPCSSCPPRKEFNFKGECPDPSKSSSIGVTNCQVPHELQYCTSNLVYRQDIEPPVKPSSKVTALNDYGVRLDMPAYTKVIFNDKVGYAGCNPLLIDAPRGQKLILDRPHYTSKIDMTDIYSPYVAQYGKQPYDNYTDINAGFIQYYAPEDLNRPYFEPNFVTPALVDHTIQMDPMGRVLPTYNRNSLQPYMWNQCKPDQCDSKTHDTLEFRQELMEKQMRKMNQQRWLSRWTVS
jgi:hypothetical protein